MLKLKRLERQNSRRQCDAVPVEEIIPDSKDIVFYEVVMEGRKEHDDTYLVIGNIKHFPAKSYIVTPKEMLEIMHKV